jgi:hypothetical protein
MVSNSGGPNPGGQGSQIPWERVDSSEEEAAAASQRLLDGKQSGRDPESNNDRKRKKKKQKLKNGIELVPEQDTGCSMDQVTEPDNIKEIISKDEATTGSR